MISHHNQQLQIGVRLITFVLLPAVAVLSACRSDDAPTPQTLAPGTTVTTTTRTVTTAPPLPQTVGSPSTTVVQAPMDAIEMEQSAPVVQSAARAVPSAHNVAAPIISDATPAHRPENRGRVVGIEPLVQQESPSGAGAVVGGLLGGVLGHQVGGGNGRNAATVLGAVGGAVVGNHVEKNRSTHVTGYRVSVRTDAGHVREFQRRDVGDLNVGAPVRIVNGGVQPA